MYCTILYNYSYKISNMYQQVSDLIVRVLLPFYIHMKLEFGQSNLEILKSNTDIKILSFINFISQKYISSLTILLVLKHENLLCYILHFFICYIRLNEKNTHQSSALFHLLNTAREHTNNLYANIFNYMYSML